MSGETEANAAGASAGTARRLASAARVITEVIENGRALDEALEEEATRFPDAGRAALQALAFGTVRLWPRLERMMQALLDKPHTAPLVRALIGLGLHQLEESTHPPHAVVNETVEATRHLGHARAAGLVNAILRRYQREGQALRARLEKDPVARFAHPQWLIERIRADWPGEWQRLLEENNSPAPLWLRVNRRRTTPDEYLAQLEALGMKARRNEMAPDAIALEASVGVRDVPGFAAGEVSVQDAAAQLAAPLLQVADGMRVLDACAAPGGKACHILERHPRVAELVALDIAAARLQRVRENLDRLGLAATLVAGDARDPAAWWDGKPFERILVDAPCSGTGVIRRHPDIKILRRPGDIERMAAVQGALLRSAWGMLAPGGRLLYATCSVLRAENDAIVDAFIASQPRARSVPVGRIVPDTLPDEGPIRPQGPNREGLGLRIPTGAAGMDGFYYACLEKP
jgi:16S rRNA (cytosine967-C5)-methyltransferase